MYKQHRKKQRLRWKKSWNGYLAACLLGVPMLVHSAAHGQERLSEETIAHHLQSLPGWSRQGETLHCTYAFADFVAAIAFVNTLVEPAEALAHHPDLAIAYNRVSITLSTHDAGGLTALDFALAEAIAQMAAPTTCLP